MRVVRGRRGGARVTAAADNGSDTCEVYHSTVTENNVTIVGPTRAPLHNNFPGVMSIFALSMARSGKITPPPARDRLLAKANLKRLRPLRFAPRQRGAAGRGVGEGGGAISWRIDRESLTSGGRASSYR
ncbi:hypothetical protein EVAR_24118_1 [Eumeta japonica]|uniref:Uncharacterized protein n=1 Tax=Eumeta variegata TaxID=151549 RepID=A0A4C1YLU4_EUMVA|nr:hypothetical protein EVAR_24118_1 [Eumeta japonica]